MNPKSFINAQKLRPIEILAMAKRATMGSGQRSESNLSKPLPPIVLDQSGFSTSSEMFVLSPLVPQRHPTCPNFPMFRFHLQKKSHCLLTPAAAAATHKEIRLLSIPRTQSSESVDNPSKLVPFMCKDYAKLISVKSVKYCASQALGFKTKTGSKSRLHIKMRKGMRQKKAF